MNETNRCTVNFQSFINGTIALHVLGSFSAHHQERLSAVRLLWYNFMQLGDRLLSGSALHISGSFSAHHQERLSDVRRL